MNGAAVILAITKSTLGTAWMGESYGWQGAKKDYWGATPLGIFDRSKSVDGLTGKVAIYAEKPHTYGGWGFGVGMFQGGDSQLSWANERIPLEVIEIAVTGRPLTASEREFLLE